VNIIKNQGYYYIISSTSAAQKNDSPAKVDYSIGAVAWRNMKLHIPPTFFHLATT
jgi:hypothetical protein